jgi:thiamine pyrophosphokinase
MQLYPYLIHRNHDTEINDLTKSVLFCLSQGIDDIIILGATGRREDHTLANIGLLSDYVAMGSLARISMITDNGVFNAITTDSQFDSFAGQQVSLFTIDPTAHVESEGLLYPLPPRFASWWCGSLNQSLGDSFLIRTSAKTIIFRAFNDGK